MHTHICTDTRTHAQYLQSHDKLLWEDLIEHSLKQAEQKNSDFLASLLDHLGSCGLNPIELISQVGEKSGIFIMQYF